MPGSRVVLCMKWGNRYPADYVNVLYHAAQTHIRGGFRFVCLTDDATGLTRGIEALPIPDIGLAQDNLRSAGAWQKLAIYLPTLYDLRGRCLFVNVDSMVFEGLGDMFDFSSGLVATDTGPGWQKPPTTGADRQIGTCVFAFDLGRETQIVSRFQSDPEAAKRIYRQEQDFVAAHAKTLDVFPPGWVLSFKRHLRQLPGLDLFRQPHPPPPGTRVLAFDGPPKPADLLNPNTGFWDRFPHLGHGQVGWIMDYWTGHGGKVPL